MIWKQFVMIRVQFTHVSSFSCRGRLRNWQMDCFMVGLYCVTVTWQQIFKGSLKTNGRKRFAACCCWTRTSCQVGWRSETVTADSGNARSFVLLKKAWRNL